MANQALHPGETIAEELEARAWNQRDLAYITGYPEQSISRVLSRKCAVTPEMAKALARAFDVPAELFVNLQKTFDLA